MTTVWVPCDAAARAVGADEVAEAFAAAGATVRRNGVAIAPNRPRAVRSVDMAVGVARVRVGWKSSVTRVAGTVCAAPAS